TGATGLGFGLAPSGGTVTLIGRGSVWSYLDDGSDQDTAWRAPSFDDSAWASGPAQLGYGDGDEATVVSYGPSASGKYITTYFRHTFELINAWSVTDLAVRLLRDDGAVMYLNGQELPRSNMPDGPIDYLTRASGGATDEDAFYEYTVDPTMLVEGDNVLAVEIHQVSPTSSDISFDLELVAETSTVNLIETDLQPQMLGVNASALLRAPFTVGDPDEFSDLFLHVAYEDGYVAYLNGTRVTVRNAPTTPGWNSAALTDRPDEEATRFEIVGLASYLDLLVAGENVLAIHAMNDAASNGTFLICPKLTAVTGSTVMETYFTTPTPGAENVPGVLGMVADTKFSVDRGFHDAPFDVEITTETEDAEIHYTLDGSAPTATTGTVYTAPVHVTTTTTLRAAAFKPGYLPTDIDAHTYIFLNDVIHQPVQPAGFPTTWYTRAADYEMDPYVVNDPLYSGRILDALRSHPTISLVMDIDDLFDEEIGIYSNSQEHGREWERPCSVELIGFPDADDMQVSAGLRMQGNASRQPSRPKHNMRLVFRGEYGPTMLEFPLFAGSDVTRFNSIILRGQNGDSWIHPNSNQRRRAQYIRDQWHRDVQAAMGHRTLDQDHFHLYINGLYWGFFHVFVRSEAEFMADAFGGSEEDYDVIRDLNRRAGEVEAIDGDLLAWNAMMALANGNIADNANYLAIQQYLDLENFVDYMLINFYSANTDWDASNWRAARKREPGAGFMFFPWDSERTVGNSSSSSLVVDGNVTGKDVANRPTHMHQRLTLNEEYRLFFADRMHRHLFNDGVLTPRKAAESWQRRV
ncbi:MAG: chitobiase/beta-hexosaminidase C-terminal domain-containing protein, partial [Phycisphaerae bacterium]